MKKLLTLLTTLFALTAFAADSGYVTITTGANQVTNVATNTAALASSIEIYNGSSIPITYAVIDSPNQSVFFTNAPYAGVSQYLSNLTVLSTNFFGHIYTNTISNVLFSVTNTIPGNTNDYRVVITGPLASSNSVTLTIPGGFYFARGIMITNSYSSNNTFRVVYTPSL